MSIFDVVVRGFVSCLCFILMIFFVFICGLILLVMVSGVGVLGNCFIGIVVVGGMFIGIFVGIFFVFGFYFIFESWFVYFNCNKVSYDEEDEK